MNNQRDEQVVSGVWRADLGRDRAQTGASILPRLEHAKTRARVAIVKALERSKLLLAPSRRKRRRLWKRGSIIQEEGERIVRQRRRIGRAPCEPFGPCLAACHLSLSTIA